MKDKFNLSCLPKIGNIYISKINYKTGEIEVEYESIKEVERDEILKKALEGATGYENIGKAIGEYFKNIINDKIERLKRELK